MADRRPIGAGATSIGPIPSSLPDDPTILSALSDVLRDPMGVGTGSQQPPSPVPAMAPHLPPSDLFQAGQQMPNGRLSRSRPTPVDHPDVSGLPADDLMEMLGRIFTGGKGTKLTDRVRLTSYDPHANTATLHSVANNVQYNSPLDEMLSAMKAGKIVPELPPGAVEGQPVTKMIARLLKLVK